MFKRKKKKTGCKTPKFRRSMPAPKPNPNQIPPASVKITCTHSTPCGWCTKWDKKCDKKIGGGNDIKPRKKKNAELEYIKSGKGMPNDKEWFR